MNALYPSILRKIPEAISILFVLIWRVISNPLPWILLLAYFGFNKIKAIDNAMHRLEMMAAIRTRPIMPLPEIEIDPNLFYMSKTEKLEEINNIMGKFNNIKKMEAKHTLLKTMNNVKYSEVEVKISLIASFEQICKLIKELNVAAYKVNQIKIDNISEGHMAMVNFSSLYHEETPQK